MKLNLNGTPSKDWVDKFDNALSKKLEIIGGTLQNMGSDNPSTPKGNL